MAAINENIIKKERNKLEEVIPLEMPYSLVIDPCNLCNFKCHFCALQTKKEVLDFQKQLMNMELFKKIIDDLKEFQGELKVLRISGQGEPLLNPNFSEMVKYAKEQNVAEYIETVTNGSRLCPELNQKIIESGIDRIRISIEALDAKGYLEIAGTKINFDEFVKNIRDLHERSGACEIYCKIVNVAIPTQEKKDRFFAIFEEICDRIFIDNIIPLWSDFSVNSEKGRNVNKGMHGQEIKSVKVCPYPFYSLIVNSDGEVTVCCADWKRKLVVGDLKQQSMIEIWKGNKLRNFWKEMLKGNKNNFEMCKKCSLPMYDCNDDIDEFAEVILKRL